VLGGQPAPGPSNSGYRRPSVRICRFFCGERELVRPALQALGRISASTSGVCIDELDLLRTSLRKGRCLPQDLRFQIDVSSID